MMTIAKTPPRSLMSRPAFVVLAGLMISLPPIAAGADRDGPEQEAIEKEAMRNCEANQSNLNLCSYKRYKQLDERLNALYQIQLKRLRGSEQEKRFIEAERAWLKYINADCLYQNGPREESGTIWPLLQNNCLSHHLQQRIDLLQSFVNCTQDGCLGQ